MRKFAPVFALLALAAAALVFAFSALAGPADDPDGDLLLNDAHEAQVQGRVLDNCPTVFNDDNMDYDKDGIGDACDPDITGMADAHWSEYALHWRLQNGDDVQYFLPPHEMGCVTFESLKADGTPAGPSSDVCVHGSGVGYGPFHFHITQKSLPAGCTGGIQGTLDVNVPVGKYVPIDIVYNCPGYKPKPAATTTTTSTTPGAPAFTPVKRVLHDAFARAGQKRTHTISVPDGATAADVVVTPASAVRTPHVHVASLGDTLRFAVIAKRAGKATVTVTFR